MFSPHNYGNSVVAARFIKTLKNKIYKDITDVYFHMLNNFVGKYNNTYHNSIISYGQYNVDSNAKDPNLK